MLWQRLMIGCARSARLTRLIQSNPRLAGLAGRFTAGEDLAAASTRLAALEQRGLRASLFYLGEYLDDPAAVAATVEYKIAALRTMGAREGGDVHVSVDPTQIGLQLSPSLAADNARRLAGVAAGFRDRSLCRLMLDMEDASVTDFTLDLHRRLHGEGLPVAVTVQAYLHRSPGDIQELIALSSPSAPVMVRLVKGAFAEPARHAHTARRAIDAAYLALAGRLLSAEARQRRAYPAFATHDGAMIAAIRGLAREQGVAPGGYEFEMLLGVREGLALALAGEGERVRVYAPFGADWWPYTARRVGENPRNAVFALRALLSPR